MLLLVLVGCAHPIEGVVTSSTGGPVVGAQLASPGCDAVTGDDGRFTVQCDDAPRTFLVSHPAYLGARVDWIAGPLETVLTPIPTDPGVYVAEGASLTLLAPVAMQRTGDDTAGWRFCLAADGPAGASVPPGDVRLLDNHDVDWRLFPVGADGCMYTLQHGNGEWWTSPSTAILVTRSSELAAGRSWLQVHLEVGEYALVDWYAGSPVPTRGGGYGARRLVVR